MEYPALLSRIARARFASVADAFASPLRTSHYLELVNPLWTSHAMRARVVAVRDETASARTLTLRPGRGWRAHRAGQHVRVTVAMGGMQHTRTFSISSPPERDDGCITITVNAAPDGYISRHLVRDVRPGTYLRVGLPTGELTLPDAVPVRPFFITAGSGITPIMSMLRSWDARGGIPDAVHLHYARDRRNVIFADELAALAATHARYHLSVIPTREGAAKDRHFVGAELERACPDWRDRDVYACGPENLLAAVESHWNAAGLARRLHVERFHSALARLPADVTAGTVRFAQSGREVATDGRTNLLRVAEQAGLNPAHGCRMGICHSCDTRLLGGCVRDLRSGALASEPGTTVQLCVSAAAGAVELDL